MSLFIHALQQVVGNFQLAIRIGGILLMLYLFQDLGDYFDWFSAWSADGRPKQGTKLLIMIFVLISSVTVAIAWHRFILRDERDVDGMSLMYGTKGWDRIIPYFGRSMLIFLIAVVCAAALYFVGSFAIAYLGFSVGTRQAGVIIPSANIWVLLCVCLIVVIWLSNRLALSLPAVALDKRVRLLASWRQTAAMNFQIIMCSIMMGVAVVGLVLAESAIGNMLAVTEISTLIIGMIASCTGWFCTLFGISVLTTLYGHLVENRPLNP